MKTSILILHILCSSTLTLTELKGKESKHKIAKRNAQALQIAIDQLIKTSADLKTAYVNNDLETAGDVGLTLVESMPIIGDIVHVLNNNPDPSFDFKSGLITINDNLKVLNTKIKKIGVRVEELSKTIDLSVIKNQVATDKREISNCYADLLLFLPNPLSNAEQDRLIDCYSKFSYVRQVGGILRNDKLTFMQKPIFDQIIDITGYCDGARIEDVFGFLLGIYIEGCTALITSEVLKYGNKSTTYRVECKTTIQASRNLLIEILINCKLESCSKYIQAMTNMLKMDQASNIESQLKAIFPWFNFVIVMLRKEVSSGIALYNLHVFNYLTLSSSDVVYRVLIWAPTANSTTSGDNTYGVGYKENEMEFIYNGINLHKTTINGLTQLTGFHDNISYFQTFCSRDVNIADSEVGTNIKDLPSILQTDTSFAGWKIAVIIISLVILLVVIVCCIKCCRN
ncbi:unnamed protein product [Mytilus coruscus]|uniref:Uncharacterized protein n=1 Tax=Mytilus coruscus TaxID=42192 RepID=A0A6J8B6P3_MYTCO|nr:unnamed protein product [Mytilus coruscus]